jgi:hypothetical protein
LVGGKVNKLVNKYQIYFRCLKKISGLFLMRHNGSLRINPNLTRVIYENIKLRHNCWPAAGKPIAFFVSKPGQSTMHTALAHLPRRHSGAGGMLSYCTLAFIFSFHFVRVGVKALCNRRKEDCNVLESSIWNFFNSVINLLSHIEPFNSLFDSTCEPFSFSLNPFMSADLVVILFQAPKIRAHSESFLFGYFEPIVSPFKWYVVPTPVEPTFSMKLSSSSFKYLVAVALLTSHNSWTTEFVIDSLS